MSFVIAIDGPSCAGKSTIANSLASELQILHIQSGAFYRCLGLQMIKNNANLQDKEEISQLLLNSKITFKNIDGQQIILLNSEDVTELIRTKEVTDYTSKLASVTLIRDSVNTIMRKYAQTHSLIIDGRDIGTEVFPNAEVKFFLNAAPIVRAKRKQAELSQLGNNIPLNDVLKSIYTWDYDAINRKYGALKRAPDSIYIDTSSLEIDKLKEIMLKIIEEKVFENTFSKNNGREI